MRRREPQGSGSAPRHSRAMRIVHGSPACRPLTGGTAGPYLYCGAAIAPESKVAMSTSRIRITEVLSIIGDAIAAASAIETGRQPKARTLRGLGIDPKAFRKIRY